MLSLDSQFGAVSLRFTVPERGSYIVSGFYQHTDQVGGPVRVSILEDGTLPLLDVSPLTGPVLQVRFSFPLNLNAGETLDFIEASTTDFRFLATGLSLQITEVPEPTTWQLLLLGAGGITALFLRKPTAAGSSFK
jgi:hypothetical protein